MSDYGEKGGSGSKQTMTLWPMAPSHRPGEGATTAANHTARPHVLQLPRMELTSPACAFLAWFAFSTSNLQPLHFAAPPPPHHLLPIPSHLSHHTLHPCSATLQLPSDSTLAPASAPPSAQSRITSSLLHHSTQQHTYTMTDTQVQQGDKGTSLILHHLASPSGASSGQAPRAQSVSRQ